MCAVRRCHIDTTIQQEKYNTGAVCSEIGETILFYQYSDLVFAETLFSYSSAVTVHRQSMPFAQDVDCCHVHLRFVVFCYEWYWLRLSCVTVWIPPYAWSAVMRGDRNRTGLLHSVYMFGFTVSFLRKLLVSLWKCEDHIWTVWWEVKLCLLR